MSSILVHVGVRASDLQQTIRFWRDALGLRVASEHGHCCNLTDGYHNFRVFQHEGPPRPPHVGGMLDYLHIGLRVPDLHEAASRCQELGFQIIWEGLEGIGEEHREILVLKELQGFRYGEIAAILQIPEGTVASRLYHARRALKEALEEMGATYP